MGRVVGFALMAVGLGAAAYVLPIADFGSNNAADQRVANIISVATSAAAPKPATSAQRADQAPERSPATPAATAALLTAAVPAPSPAPRGPDFSAQSSPLGQGSPLTKASPLPTAPKVLAVPAQAQPTDMEPKAARLAPIAPPTVRAPDTSTSAQRAPRGRSDGDQRLSLGRDIQTELKRVGCFDGEASGEWTPATRRSMKTFTERVNATLPVDEPDYILLTLLQGQKTRVCGGNCPTGQALNADGRCLPSAVMAQTQKRPVPTKATAPTSGWEPTVTAPMTAANARTAVTPQGEPAFPRIAAAPSQTVVTGSIEPPVMAAPQAVARPTVAPAPVVSSMAPIVAPTALPPGRMAVGGPTAAPTFVIPAPVPVVRADPQAAVPLAPRVASAALQAGEPLPLVAPQDLRANGGNGPQPLASAVEPPQRPLAAQPVRPPQQQARRPTPPRGLGGPAPANYPVARVQPSPRQTWARNIFRQNEVSGR